MDGRQPAFRATRVTFSPSRNASDLLLGRTKVPGRTPKASSRSAVPKSHAPQSRDLRIVHHPSFVSPLALVPVGIHRS